MKKLFLFSSLAFLITGCVSSKTEKEFNDKRSEVVIILDESKLVEKKTAINILIAEYINSAPKDSTLLNIFNPYLLYYLDDLGYKKIVIKNERFNGDLYSGKELVYSVSVGSLQFKEFKHKETVSDGKPADDKTIKMRGIEVNPSALVVEGIDNAIGNKDALHVKANALREESQQGQFKQTYGVKDMVNGSTSGSTKYIYQVQQLQDGVFQNLCVEGAFKLSREIDYALKRIYQKQKKRKK